MNFPQKNLLHTVKFCVQMYSGGSEWSFHPVSDRKMSFWNTEPDVDSSYSVILFSRQPDLNTEMSKADLVT